MISFRIVGPPVPKGRPRCQCRTNGYGKTYPKLVTPDDTAAAENAIGWEFKAQNPGHELFDVPVWVTIVVMEDKHGGHYGDWDNYAKTVCDALNGVAWSDDKLVESAAVRVLRHQEVTGIEVMIGVINDPADEAIVEANTSPGKNG